MALRVGQEGLYLTTFEAEVGAYEVFFLFLFLFLSKKEEGRGEGREDDVRSSHVLSWGFPKGRMNSPLLSV